MSQTNAILRDLKRGKRVTPMSALNDHNCFRLSGRIYDLKKQGHTIKTKIVHDPQSGKRYAQYRMAKGRAA